MLKKNNEKTINQKDQTIRKSRNLRKSIEKEYFTEDIERMYRRESTEWKKDKGYFIYDSREAQRHKGGLYLSNSKNDIFKQIDYTDGINPNCAYNSRNILYEKYDINVNPKEVYGYKKFKVYLDHEKKLREQIKEEIHKRNFSKVRKLVYRNDFLKNLLKNKLNTIK
jgi:hypothetical protein